MARYREKHSHDEAREFVDAIAGTFGVILFVITLVGVVAAPLLVAVVAPGFIGDGGGFELATLMLRFTFPYLFFVSLTAFAGGILNTYGRFAVPAFTPVILNVVLIAGAIWLAPHLRRAGNGAGLCGVRRRRCAAAVPGSIPAAHSGAAAAEVDISVTRACSEQCD